VVVTYDEFVERLDEAGVTLCKQGTEIELEGPDEVLTAELRALARKYRRRLANELEPQNEGKSAAQSLARSARGTPLSWFQERLWFLHARNPEDLSYNIPILLALDGPLNVAALQSSVWTIVDRHESLRTVYRVEKDGTPLSYVTNSASFELPLLDVSDDDIPTHVAEVVEHRFNLATGPVFIGRLLRLSRSQHVLLLNVHHIAADGWSMQGVFLRELVECYQAATAGRRPNLPPLATQYRDFARWQRESDTTEGLQYFLASLEGYQDTLELPSDHLRCPESGKRSEKFVYRYSPEFAKKLERFSLSHGVTVFMALYGALALAVSRYCGRDDVCLGTTSSGRNRVDLEPLIGFFINILPLRLKVDEALSAAAFMGQVRGRALADFKHQMVPFEQIVHAGGYGRSLKANPLVPVIVRHQNFPQTSLRAPLADGLVIGPYTGAASEPGDEQKTGGKARARCEIELSYVGTSGELAVEVVYASDLYERATIERLLSHHEHLLEQMFADPSAPLASLELLRPAEVQRLYAVHDGADEGTGDERSFSLRFTELSRQVPDAACCEDSEGQWSYARVEARSNQLAHCLLADGVQPGDIVGVCLKRGAHALVALLAIWKAGAAYVPLDPAYPAHYLRQILDDARPVTIVTTAHLQECLSLRDDPCFVIDRRTAVLDASSPLPPPEESGLQALAYVMYTSGSTGIPKGVRVPHRQLVNWLGGIQTRWPFQDGEIIAQKTTLAFAVSVKELFAGLLNGCRLVFLDDETVKDTPRLCEALQKYRISRLNLVPSHLTALLEHVEAQAVRLPDLRILITAGEPLTAEVVKACRAALPQVRLLNNYGCTELNDITYYEVSDYSAEQGFVPIGKAIQNTRLYVLDRRGRPVPEGVAGELHVATLGMSEGYQGRPELTEERYLPNRFGDATRLATTPYQRLYNTGDVVRWLPDGNLDYIGRWDLQVKVRGFRVDVRHVEKVLGDYPGIGQKAVVAEGERLLAFYVLQPDKQVELGALRDFLRARLPSHMVPDAFVLLEDMPRLPNGKLNRRALVASERTLQQSDAHVATETEAERALARIWADVLELSVEAIGRHSHFFELGGHSLAATRVVARVKDALRVDLPLSVIFEKPSLLALAEHVATMDRDPETLPPAAETEGAPQNRSKKSVAPALRSRLRQPSESISVSPAHVFENRLLEDKVALVTGASRGIGEAIALLLARSGARVAINFRDSERRAGEVKARIEAEGGTAIAVQADVTRADEVRRLVAEVRRSLGPVDVLVANASIGFKKQAFVDYDFSDLEQKVSSELKAVFYPCQAVVPDMLERQSGSIIAISSTLSKHANGGFAAQSSAKAALDAFVRSLAVELGPEGIRVNTVAPGVTLTEAAAHMPQAHKAATAARTPLGRNGTASDMAGTVLFLASELSRFMTGCYLPVDGGITML
jgi:amino acid adenylation domain-containing protein